MNSNIIYKSNTKNSKIIKISLKKVEKKITIKLTCKLRILIKKNYFKIK